MRILLTACAVAALTASAHAQSPGAEVYRARCASCHGERLPLAEVMLPRYRPLHAALRVTPAEARPLEAWLDEQRKERLRTRPAPDLAPPARQSLERGDRPPLPPRWVLEPWKWKNEHSGPADVLADVRAMEAHGIPCGVYLIDSPWSTGYNTLRFYPKRWAQPGERVTGRRVIADLQARGLKTVLWVTAIINDGSKSKPAWDTDAERALWEYGRDNDLLAKNALWQLTLGSGLPDERLIRWWKGVGSHIDLDKPEGRAWWYQLLDRALLDLGVDGFKVDGGWPPMTQTYYDQTSRHTARRTLGRGVTISRPNGGNLGSATACWTGDEESTFAGMRHAMDRMRRASEAGYSTVGSDIGGFGGSPSEAVLLRWAQLGCFSGVMELGGGGVHEPWELGERCARIYKTYATLRTELIPYLYSYAHLAHQTGTPLMRWQGKTAFLCGDELFVQPVARDDGAARVRLPPGRWIDYFRPESRHDGGAPLEVRHDLETFPLYVREGAILPLEVWSDATGNGTAGSCGALTLALYPAEGALVSRFDFRWGEVPGARPTRLTLESKAGELSLSLDQERPQPYPRLVLKVHGDYHTAEALYRGRRVPATVTRSEGVSWVRIEEAEGLREVRLRARRYF